MTIEEFIEARLAEDEAIARAASGQSAEWRVYEGCVRGAPFYEGDPAGGYPAGGETTIVAYDGTPPFEVEAQQSRHIARHDPARVLRQVAAHRVALSWYLDDDDVVMGPTIRAIAAIWSDHPDYRPEWAPEPRLTE